MNSNTKKELIQSTLAILGSAIVLGGIGYVLISLEPKLVQIKPKPSPTPTPPVPVPPGPVSLPMHLVGPLQVSPGRRYNVVVDISGVISILASTSSVKSQAQSQGFSNVNVYEDRPRHFPPGPNGDYFIEGTYNGTPKAFDRSQAGGRVTIVDAWVVA